MLACPKISDTDRRFVNEGLNALRRDLAEIGYYSGAFIFGVQYAFLREFNPNVSIKEITYVNGNARYSSKPVEINGKQYLITNELYSKTLHKFLEWADSIEMGR